MFGKAAEAAQAAHLLWLTFTVAFLQLTAGLRFGSLHIPALVQRHASPWLWCQYELEAGEQVYSVKWYRNNEEFYRLIWLGADQPASQQHFGQSGLHVMLGSSNATHVRLLNASLDTEGLYACEISTQNLSTIRYEREIRVYVLAQWRPNIIGFKGRYSPADRVDLICASDFSRPQPALAWFINGRRIRTGSPWFELESRRRFKQSEPSLVATSLALRFRLTNELVAQLGGEPLKLRCEYRLTELVGLSSNRAPDLTGEPGRRGRLRLSKSSSGQVSQSLVPTADRMRRFLVRLALRQQLNGSDFGSGCSQVNSLGPQDPLLVQSDQLGLGCASLGSLLAPDESGNEDAWKEEHKEEAWAEENKKGSDEEDKLACLSPETIRLAQPLISSLVSGRQVQPAAWSEPGQLPVAERRLSAREEAHLSPTGSGRGGPETHSSAAEPAPLLEWFINNQETPSASSASSDYADYFANLDTLGQQQKQPKALWLTQNQLEKLNKLSPNSLDNANSAIQLRCSSTQAHLLASEYVLATIATSHQARTPTNGTGWQQSSRKRNHHHHHQQQQQQQSLAPSHSSSSAAVSHKQPEVLHLLALSLLPLILSSRLSWCKPVIRASHPLHKNQQPFAIM